MSAIDYIRACGKFVDRFGESLVERTERSLGEDYKGTLEKNPRLVFERMMRIVWRQYVVPYELLIGIDSMMKEDFRIDSWEMAVSFNQRFSLKEHEREIRDYIASFYRIASSAGIELRGSTFDQRYE